MLHCRIHSMVLYEPSLAATSAIKPGFSWLLHGSLTEIEAHFHWNCPLWEGQTVETFSLLLLLLTKLSLHTPSCVTSPLTDIFCAGRAYLGSQFTRDVTTRVCLRATTAKISAQMWPLLTNSWNCVPSPLILPTELCVLHSQSQQHQTATGRTRDWGVFWLRSSQALVILPLNTIISFPLCSASNNLYWVNRGCDFTSRSIKITWCQLLFLGCWVFFLEQLVCVFSHKVGQKLLMMLDSNEWVIYSGGVFKRREYTRNTCCRFLGVTYVGTFLLHNHYNLI